MVITMSELFFEIGTYCDHTISIGPLEGTNKVNFKPVTKYANPRHPGLDSGSSNSLNSCFRRNDGCFG